MVSHKLPRLVDQAQTTLRSAPSPELLRIDLQLKGLSERLAALPQPGRHDDVILAMRDDLAAIRGALLDAAPRNALEALQGEVRALGKRLNDSQFSSRQREDRAPWT